MSLGDVLIYRCLLQRIQKVIGLTAEHFQKWINSGRKAVMIVKKMAL
ncbi:hypothetical protein SCG7086_BD_00130 [Chlamydiales bacterium SCGC AG-110-P3]|nr:hypothetical protein SCG7086_BD_00130 [Chlamydiales bacterium SCGC AG-110-P3]